MERHARRGREDRNESVADSKDERITEGRKVAKRRKEGERGGRDGRRSENDPGVHRTFIQLTDSSRVTGG